MYESKDVMVSHPAHYQSETGLEVIDVIEAFTFDLKGIEATDTGNVLKYMCLNGIKCLESLILRGDMSKIKNGVPWKELRQKEVIKESRKSWIAFFMKNLNDNYNT